MSLQRRGRQRCTKGGATVVRGAGDAGVGLGGGAREWRVGEIAGRLPWAPGPAALGRLVLGRCLPTWAWGGGGGTTERADGDGGA